MFIITILKVGYGINSVESRYNGQEKNIVGIVTNIKSDDKKNIITVKAKENILVYYYNDIELNLGDKINVSGTLEELNDNTNFNLFNYKNYMLSKNTYYKMSADSIKLIKKNKNIFYSIKDYLIKRIDKIKGSDYLKTFILGNSSEIDESVIESYRTNGISHLFSVSGMHITLLSTLILFILNKIKNSKLNYLFVIVFLIFYMFLTSFTPSVIRATFLFILLTLNRFLNLKLSTLKILLILLFISLIINPYNIYNTGFKFSYIVSLFLIFFSNLINRFNNYILKTLMTSFISFIAGIPILINNYFSINIMTILNNIIFVPIISIVIFPFSLIVLFITKLDFVYKTMINYFEKLSLFITNFKIEIILCKINLFMVIIYYVIIVFVLYKCIKRKYKYIWFIIIVIFVHTNINYIRNNPYVTFIDVGQGDSSLIHLPYNKGNILIDTGGSINYDNSKDIINYLKSEGISKIDYLIISHGDYDHMGSASNLINNFKVNNIVFNNNSYNELESKLISVLNMKKIKYYKNLNELSIDKYKLKILNTREYDNENDNSNVVYFNYNSYKFLFMGDAGIDKEKDILRNYRLSDVDILKVGHHGSNSSSSKEFINIINPKYSIISVGKNNRYSHPSKEVLNILGKTNIYRTDISGSIKLDLHDNKLKIRTCLS